MNPLSARIRKRRAPQRQTPSVSRRRSSRIQSRQRSISIPHILASYYESQSSLEQRPTDPQTSQPLGATSYTRVPASSPVEVSEPAPSKAQFQEYLCPPQTHNDQTRKRRSDGSIETGAERPPKRVRLTKKNLKAFEKMGGQRRSAGKRTTGHSSSTSTTADKESKSRSSGSQPKSSDSESKSTRSKETISTTDSGFQEAAFQNGVLDPNYSKPPANLGYRQDRLDRARDTASPSESDYRYFASAIRSAPNEASVLYETSTLLKRYDEPGYHKRFNQSFSNFPKNVGFNNGLSAAQPDMVEGLNMPEFEPFPVREKLGGAATVYPGLAATTLPHLAGEWKGPGKDMILAQTQAAYDGACMVYGRNEARSFLECPDPAGHAFVSTFTTDGTTLNTFAHYSSETQGRVKYHQFPTSSSLLISSYEDYKKSRRRLRNEQDDAKEYSEKLRDELNKKWSEKQRLDEEEDEDEDEVYQDSYELVPPPASASVPAETADFADCNSYDKEDPSNQLLTEYWTSFSASNQDESFVRIPAADSVYVSPYASFPANNQDDLFMQISTTDNGYTSPDALITPPQSSNDTSHPLEPNDIDDSNVRGHRRTRRTRTRAADLAEGLRDVDHESNVRKTRRRREG